MTIELDVSKLSPDVSSLQKALLARVVGQERAIKEIVRAYVPTTVNMHRDNRPMGVFLFMGPTGVGKSETVKIFAKYLLGDRSSLTKIDCNEYQESHETMKLLGAPPSYVGYNDTPRLAQENIDKFQTKDRKVNILLFDEIEKAHPRLFDTILNILGDGECVLGNGKKVDFRKSFIFMTSNLGSDSTRKILESGHLGFAGGANVLTPEELDDKIYRSSKEAVKKSFRPEFINRIDRTVVFRALSQDSLRKIMKIELAAVQQRIWSSPFRDFNMDDKTRELPSRRSIVFKLTKAAEDFILKEGTSEVYGARELNRTIDRFITFPIASLISSEEAKDGNYIRVDHFEGDTDLSFFQEPSPIQLGDTK